MTERERERRAAICELLSKPDPPDIRRPYLEPVGGDAEKQAEWHRTLALMHAHSERPLRDSDHGIVRKFRLLKFAARRARQAMAEDRRRA